MSKALKILLVTSGFVLLADAMIGPIYAIFVEQVGGNILTASTACAIYSIVVGLGYLIVDSPLKLFIIEVIIGLGAAIYIPAFDGVYTRHISQGKSVSQWSSWESMNKIVYGFGAIAGGLIATYLGFPILFVAMFLLCLFSAVLILVLPRELL